MSEALICGAVRTPVGAAGGTLAGIRPDDLAAVSLKALAERTDVDPSLLDDVIMGCTNQAGEDNRNVARMAALLAGFPVEVPGQTVNRLCGSGLQAVASAAQAIKAGEGSLFMGGGVESMTRAPYVMLKSPTGWNRRPPDLADTTVGWRFTNPAMKPDWTISLGETAEVVADKYGISRADQDQFAFDSQQKAASAQESGAFDDEIVPVPIPQKDGSTVDFGTDEHPRSVTLEKLSTLRTIFRKDGSVTAGSSSGINDGSAAVLIASEESAKANGLTPMARVLTTAVAGVDPSCMGIGPIPATRRALERAGLSVSDLDLIELNEAFAAQSLACINELDLPKEKVNIYGGGIALGHPLGCTGAKILTTLVHALKRTGGKRGLVTMCIGVGQGIAMIVETV